MSNHHQSSPTHNSTLQTHHHLPNLSQIKRENDSDDEDDVVYLSTVPKFEHRPEDYDPKCKCRMCLIVKKLLAECKCEDCRAAGLQKSLDNQSVNQSADGQMVVQSTENVTHNGDKVTPTNAESSTSLINNDEPTSQDIPANDHDDHSRSSTPNSETTQLLIANIASTSQHNPDHDDNSRSTTPDYLPGLFDEEDERGVLGSDDELDDVDKDDKKLDKESESDNDDDDDGDEDYKASEQESDDSDSSEVEDLVKDSLDDEEKDHLESNQESDSDDDASNSGSLAVDSAFSKSSSSKSIKKIHIKRSAQSRKHTKTIQRFLCPNCNQRFTNKTVVYRHYRTVHQQVKSFYCKWTKCVFVTGRKDNVLDHITYKHFNGSRDSEKAKFYIGKRKTSTDPIVIKSIFESKQETSRSECPLCRRVINSSKLARHIRTHRNAFGFRCVWTDCDFFFSVVKEAKKHICGDHLQEPIEAINARQIKKYLVKVNTRTGDSSKIKAHKRWALKLEDYSLPGKHDATGSEHISGDDNDHHSRSSTPDYHPPRIFDDDESEREDSSSDDDEVEVEDNDEQELDQDREKEDDDDGDEDYKASDQEGDSDDDDSSEVDSDGNGNDDEDNSSDPDFVLSSPPSQSLKRFHAERSNLSSKHTKDTDSVNRHKDWSEQTRTKRKRNACPMCGRNFVYSSYLKMHLRTHKKWGFRCTWPKCGFFYRVLKEIKQHLCADHLQCSSTVELTNAQVDQYLVRLNPKTGETSRIKQTHKIGNNSQVEHSSRPTACSNLNAKVGSFDCPKCETSFPERGKLLRHYRGKHHMWKPFYCKWPNCNFKNGAHDSVVRHANNNHFKSANRAKARTYVGERAMTSPSTQKDPIYEQLLRDISFNQNCPKCYRNFRHAGQFMIHLATHKKTGFRCTWQRCGFFYGSYSYAKQHILEEHLQGNAVDTEQITDHLVKVEPKLARTNKKKTNRSIISDTEEDENSNVSETRRSKSRKKT